MKPGAAERIAGYIEAEVKRRLTPVHHNAALRAAFTRVAKFAVEEATGIENTEGAETEAKPTYGMFSSADSAPLRELTCPLCGEKTTNPRAKLA